MAENNQKKSNGRGGKRANAGRKVGATTKKTREIADRAIDEGITPLEVMLAAMRATMSEAQRIVDEQKAAGATVIAQPLGLLSDAAAIAKDAAPYMHPRLSSVEVNANISTHEASLDDLA
ncbi:MAG: hypothetical protein H7255_20750 [Ramlibacter sp.]|nr:hypothetical protein [Ramlibacter sp.]